MQNKSRISSLINFKAIISFFLAITLVFSGSFTNLAIANDSVVDDGSLNKTTDANASSNAFESDAAESKQDNRENESLDVDGNNNDLEVLNADSSDALPELKENSWRFKDGQRTDMDDSEILPVLRAGMYDHSNVKGYGIDVSAWQGDIDWATAKNYVDFVIIRAGYGGNAYQYDDTKWFRNVEACERYGIPYGVYLYSYATDLSEAHSEADHLIRLLSGHRPTYPVYIDMEDKVTADAGRDMAINVALTVCDRIKAAGYTPGVYANLNWWRNYLNDSRFDNYERWVAQYNYRCDYDGDYRIWQYSSKGSVPGIAGYVDMNYDYGEISESTYELVYNYDFYKSTYGDLRAAYGDNRQSYFRHFVRYGMYEGRCGNPLFNPSEYKNRYADLVAAYGDEMPKYYTHFIDWGWDEGRMPRNKFDIVSYYNGNPDVRSVFGHNVYQMYIHYINFGYREGRNAINVNTLQGAKTVYNLTNWASVYDYSYYVTQYRDVASAYTWKNCKHGSLIDDGLVLQHFYEWGIQEGRRGKSTFDVAAYYNAYDDLRSAYGHDVRLYYSHYCNYGKKEGRICSGSVKMHYRTVYDGVDYSALYNGEFYADRNNDVKQAFSFNLTRNDRVVDDLLVLRHLIEYGMNEKRQPSANFNVDIYRNRYIDLQNAYGLNWKSYYLHYIIYGVLEKRTAI